MIRANRFARIVLRIARATKFQTQISVRHLPGMGGGKVRHQKFLGVWRDTAATPAKLYKIQEISCDHV